jgi:hypothetical protein
MLARDSVFSFLLQANVEEFFIGESCTLRDAFDNEFVHGILAVEESTNRFSDSHRGYSLRKLRSGFKTPSKAKTVF